MRAGPASLDIFPLSVIMNTGIIDSILNRSEQDSDEYCLL